MRPSGIRTVLRRLRWVRPAGLDDPALRARVATYLFLTGGAIAAASVALPAAGREEPAVAVGAAVAIAAGLALLVRFERATLLELNASSAAATVLISIVVRFGGDAAPSYRFFYLWVLVYAALFYRRRHLAFQLGLVAVGYALAQATRGAPLGPSALAWLVLLTTGTVIAVLVLALRERLEALLAGERRRVEELLALDALRNEIVAVVSHELRTPISSVYGAVKTLRRRDLDRRLQRELLEVIEREADRLVRLVEQILWTSRIDAERVPLAVERCDARRVVDAAVAAARANLPEHLRIEVEVVPAAVPVLADPERLEQVLDALLENAIRYSPDPGRIAVAVEAGRGRVRIAVSDPGIGIAAADRERIFARFERLDPHLGSGIAGSGLGLYIARDLVERMGGRITVESEPGRGSTFAFELPAPPERAAPGRPAPALGASTS